MVHRSQEVSRKIISPIQRLTPIDPLYLAVELDSTLFNSRQCPSQIFTEKTCIYAAVALAHGLPFSPRAEAERGNAHSKASNSRPGTTETRCDWSPRRLVQRRNCAESQAGKVTFNQAGFSPAK
jgi:hypothetical protein